MNEIERDRFGRPLILMPDGSKDRAYTRATTVAETLSDRYNLERWMQRQCVLGMSKRPDLVALASRLAPTDRDDLNKIVTECHDEAGSKDKADLGTLLHYYTEEIDAGRMTL